MLPHRVNLKNVKKISAARNYSAALTHSGEVYVWGHNHYGQLGVSEDIVAVPKLIETGCFDIEAGEGVVALVKEDCIMIAGFNNFKGFMKVEIFSRPVQMCVGDLFVAYVDRFGEVYRIGGAFSEKERKSFFYLKEIEKKFVKVDMGFFSGRVKKLFGKYSYHVAIVED